MAEIFRTSLIPVIRESTKSIVGAYNLGGFKGFLGDETTYELPSGHEITIEKWTPTSQNSHNQRAVWIMACVITDTVYKSGSWEGYPEIVRLSEMSDETDFVGAVGLPNRVIHTKGALLDVLSYTSTIQRPPVCNVNPVVAGSVNPGGEATTTEGTWVAGDDAVFTAQWQMETAVGSGVFANLTDEEANVYEIAKSFTATVTIASPSVWTAVAHGQAANTPVRVATDGALPTNFTANSVTYYIKNPADDTFELSATPGGDSINGTGSQSGTHTVKANIGKKIRCLITATDGTGETTATSNERTIAYP